MVFTSLYFGLTVRMRHTRLARALHALLKNEYICTKKTRPLPQACTMLGYNHTQSSKEVLQHHESLKKRIPGKFHSELDCAYEWVKQPQFMTALGHNTVESWNHLAHSMDNPPDARDPPLRQGCLRAHDHRRANVHSAHVRGTGLLSLPRPAGREHLREGLFRYPALQMRQDARWKIVWSQGVHRPIRGQGEAV